MGLFQRNKKDELNAYCQGQVIQLEDIKDAMFSKGMIGDGIAIEPENGDIYSPIDGTVTMVFPTKHALGIHSEEGLDVLIHAGIDTVKLKGEGFEAFVEEGEIVKKGQLLLKMNLKTVENHHFEKSVICVITEPRGLDFEILASSNVKVGNPLLKIKK